MKNTQHRPFAPVYPGHLPFRFNTARGLALLLCTGALSCSSERRDPPAVSGGQTGDEGRNRYTHSGSSANSPCDTEERELNTEITTYGMSLEALLTGFSQAAPVPLHWKNYVSGGVEVDITEAGSTSLEFTFTRAPGTVFEVSERPYSGLDTEELCDGVGYDVPVDVEFRTADGALQESFPVYLTILSKHVAFVQHRVDPQALAGDLALKSGQSQWQSSVLDFNWWLLPGGSQGRIEPILRAPRQGSVVPATCCEDPADPIESEVQAPGAAAPTVPLPRLTELREPHDVERSRYIASWPGSLQCGNGMSPVPSDMRVLNRSAKALMTQIEDAFATLASGNESAPSLRFVAPDDNVCLTVGRRAISFPALADLTLPGSDNSGRLALRVLARADVRGDVESIRVARLDAEQPLREPQLTTALGEALPGTSDFSDLYLQFEARLTEQENSRETRVQLRVHGHTPGQECETIHTLDAGPPPAAGDAGCWPSEFTRDAEQGSVPPGQPLLDLFWSDN